jgi:hypothetical protein
VGTARAPRRRDVASVAVAVALAGLSLALCAVPVIAQPSASPCAGVRCGEHGECFPESSEAYCLCDEGYQAIGTTCARAPRAAPSSAIDGLGARIVAIASAEIDRPLDRVGTARQGVPGPLSQFVRAGSFWCSDFVSWVYRAADAPFTGGYRGGWLLTNNAAIRRWFARRGGWVAHGSAEWAAFSPEPGDYVRIHTPTWGHSAIVRSVAEGTLELIEGNDGGRVRTVRYAPWRAHPRIDGFGRTIALARAIHPASHQSTSEGRGAARAARERAR